MKTKRRYNKVFLGYANGEQSINNRVYLSPPSWDCGWYWGFGYIGNKDMHYHIDGLKKHEKYNHDAGVWEYEFFNLYDGIKKHFGNTLRVRPSDLWTLAELFETFYSLKDTAEVLGRGGSHLTANPCKDVIMNTDEVTRINNEVLPAIFDEIYKILDRNADNEKLYKKLVSIDNDGLTSETVVFMIDNGFTPDDLKGIDGLNRDDVSRLHSEYWRVMHAKKTKSA